MVKLNRFKWALIKSLRKIRFKSLRKIRFKSLRKIRFESLRKIRFESLRKIRFNLLRKIHFNLRRKNRFNSLQNQLFTFVGIRIILLFFAFFGQYKFKRLVYTSQLEKLRSLYLELLPYVTTTIKKLCSGPKMSE